MWPNVVEVDGCNTGSKNSKSFPKFEAGNIGKYEHFSYAIMKKYSI